MKQIQHFVKLKTLFNSVHFLPLLLAASLQAFAPVEVTIDPSQSGKPIAPDFIGVSYETESLLPDSMGKHYFSPENKSLIAQFKTLGIKSLRIGGSSVDDPKVAIPPKLTSMNSSGLPKRRESRSSILSGLRMVTPT